MPSRDIVLVVDHKWRDLPGMAALAVTLEDSHGLTTGLVPYSQWQQSLIEDRPQVLAVSILYGRRGREIVRAAREMGVKIVVLMTEGRPNNIHSMTYSVGRGSGIGDADMVFAWSATLRDFMLQERVLTEDRVKVVGAHRFDIYRPTLDRLIVPRKVFAEKYGLDPQRPIVSWATNFTIADFHLQNQDFLVRDWKNLGVSSFSPYTRPLESARNDWEARSQSLAIMRELLRARPQIQLMVKPHPAEHHDAYKEFVLTCRRELGNRVVFIGAEYIWDVLKAADVHVHRLCTTGVEAWFLDVPSIDLHVKDYDPWSISLPGACAEAVPGCDLVQRLDSLVERVDYYLAGGRPTAEQYEARERYITRWLYKVDGLRCQEYGRELMTLVGQRGRISRPAFSRQNIPLYSKAFATKLLGENAGTRLRFWKRQGDGKTDKIGQVDKVISDDDVILWKDRVRRIRLTTTGAGRSSDLG
jgi:surface carbohydrate biosynthesis protein